MKKIVSSGLSCVMLSSGLMASVALPVSAQTASGGLSGVCVNLAKGYEALSKEMSVIHAESIGDNSVPRATEREIRKQNKIAEGNLIINLMAQHKCAPVKSVPSYVYYLIPALQCETARTNRALGKATEAEYEEKCQRSNWKPLEAHKPEG